MTTSHVAPLKEDSATGVLFRTWPCASSRAVFLLVHGLGSHSGRWDEAARFFRENGICSYALELRGFGATGGARGHIDSFETYLKDIRALARVIRGEEPDKKIFLVGESLGGLISFLAAGEPAPGTGGLVCLSAAFKSRLRFTPIQWLKTGFYLLLRPDKPLPMPFTGAMCTRDTAFQQAIDADPMGHRVASPRLLYNILRMQDRARRNARKIKLPVLFLVAGDDDRLTDSQEVKKIFSLLTAPSKKIIQYAGMYHALSVDLDRQKVFSDILCWTEKHI